MARSQLREGESEVIYFDGEMRTVVRGKIIEDTNEYLKIERDDGIRKIFKHRIVEIFEPLKNKKDGN